MLRSIRPGTATTESVRDAKTLMHAVGFGNAPGVLRLKLAFPEDVFVVAAHPLLQGYAEFVQMLPATGSQRYGGRGGQLQRGLSRALHVLDRRRAKVLPPGGEPEAIGGEAHRWTYAALVAALLQDLGRVVVGLRVDLVRSDGSRARWDPATGSMADCGAHAYAVESVSTEGEAQMPPAPIALKLFERCVPSSIRDWLQQDAQVWSELLACLQGTPREAGSLAELLRADGESGSHATPRRATDTARPASSASPTPTVAVVAAEPSADPSADVYGVAKGGAQLDAVVPAGSALAQQFIRWLDHGLGSRTLAASQADAMVFRVAEGLLLVSPQVFRAYAQQDVQAERATADTVRRLQREVLRAGWHRRTEAGGNFYAYALAQPCGQERQIQGVLIPQPQRLLRNLPPVDARLRPCDPGVTGS